MPLHHRLHKWLVEEGVEAKHDVQLFLLHGSLTSEAQDEAIRGRSSLTQQDLAMQRRVVLSTPIAESSLTINGIGVVVDSGYRKSPIFNVRTGKL